jgi:GTPase SAR1 family protein
MVEYLRQKLEAGQDTIYEAKLIIVGEGAAGKTTFVKKINNPEYPCPTPEDSTEGIDVKE